MLLKSKPKRLTLLKNFRLCNRFETGCSGKCSERCSAGKLPLPIEGVCVCDTPVSKGFVSLALL